MGMALVSVLDFFHATRQKNTTAFCILVLIMLVATTGWLFGLVWTLTLCAVSGLSYCATSCLCYRPEASQWREALSEWYEKLFLWGLNYSHRTTTSPNTLGSLTNDTTVTTNVHKNHTPSLLEPKTSGELSSGTGTLNDVRPPHPNAAEGGGVVDDAANKSTQPAKKCHKEAQKIIQLLMRDFVHSWYADITSDSEFPEDAQKILEHIAIEINVRLQQVDMEESVVELLELILPYLEVLNKAGIRSYSGTELFDVNTESCEKQFEVNPKVTHYAMKSADHERRHYRQSLDALIQCAFPPEYANCDVACTFIRELLISNLFEPLFNLLCDPAFLYEAIPLILTKAPPEKISRQLDDIERENEELERTLNRGRLIVSITGSHARKKRRFYTSSGRFGHSAYYSGIPSPTLMSPRRFSSKKRSNSIAMLPNMHRTSSGIYEPNTTWMTQSSQSLPRQQDGSCIEDTTTDPPPSSPQRFGPALPRSRVQNGTGSLYSYQNVVAESAEYPEDDLEVDMESFDHVVNGEYAFVQLSPIYIERHVRVDPGPGASNPHIAYIFKFPKWMLHDDDLKELFVMESDTHLEGMQRYSEFSKFHSALLASPLGVHGKGLSLPEKHHFSSIISKLPFTNSEHDATVIIERKQGLEKYLQSISSVEVITNSDIFREFLKSAVKNLKEANVINPQRNKKQHRMSFLGRVKGEDSQKAEPVPKRPFESVLSSYLNTHLPLPCQLNSPNSLHRGQRRQDASQSHEAPPTTPTERRKSSHSKPPRHFGGPSSLQGEHGSTYSLHSSGSGASSHDSPSTSLRRSHSFHNDVSETITENSHRQHGQEVTEAGCEATDLNGVDAVEVESMVSSQSSLRRGFNEEEEEEGCTIGGRGVTSSLTNSSTTPTTVVPPAQVHSRQPLPPSHPPTPSHATPLHPGIPSTGVHSRTRTVHVESGMQWEMNMSRLQSLFYKFLIYTHRFLSWLVFIIQKGVEPYYKPNLLVLVKVEREHSPLSNAVFCLGSEASARHCPRLWACSQNTQLALLVLAGGGVERFLWRELKLVVYDEVNWTRALYSLRHNLWPGGTFMKSSKRNRSEAEMEQLKRGAADAFKKFLPNFLPHIVGAEDYDKAVMHCLDCLRNPRLTRHFLLRVVDLMIVKIVPEITDRNFEKHLSQLRTRQPVHSPKD